MAESGRPVKYPCGTIEAYKRHKRKGETVCELCEQAKEQHDLDRAIERSGLNDIRVDADDSIDRLYVGPLVNESKELDELADLKENYLQIREKMKTSGARDLAPLSKRREELLDRIITIQNAGKSTGEKKLSAVDQMQAARQKRIEAQRAQAAKGVA